MSGWLPRTVDLLGYGASALVLLAFSLRSLIALRTVAIASNVIFIAYAVGAHLQPVLVLHVALLPVNLWRLRQCIRPAAGTGDRRGGRPPTSTPWHDARITRRT